MRKQIINIITLTNCALFDIFAIAKNTRPALHGGFLVNRNLMEDEHEQN